MKKYIFLFTLLISFSIRAQSVQGRLTLNGKSKTSLKLESNSAVQLFKDFKTGKYQLQFSFDGKDLVKNLDKETIVFFNFRTVVKKDGKLVKNVIRKHPIPYFPGDMSIPSEAFDFVSVLAITSWDDMQGDSKETVPTLNELLGLMPEGNYSVQLFAEPIEVKGKIAPVEFNFYGRKRPGKVK